MRGVVDVMRESNDHHHHQRRSERLDDRALPALRPQADHHRRADDSENGSRRSRADLLVGGPPLRYGLVIVATWYESSVRGSGPIPALAAALVLVIVIPMVGAILTAARARRAESSG